MMDSYSIRQHFTWMTSSAVLVLFIVLTVDWPPPTASQFIFREDPLGKNLFRVSCLCVVNSFIPFRFSFLLHGTARHHGEAKQSKFFSRPK